LSCNKGDFPAGGRLCSESCAMIKNFQGEKYGYPQDLNVYACDK